MIIISNELRNEIITTADNNEIPYDTFEGVLNDSYILYGTENIQVAGMETSEYMILHNKYVNVWTSETQLIQTNDIHTVNFYQEMFEGN